MQTVDTQRRIGNMQMRTGRYKGSIQEKRDRLEFQKHVLECLKIGRKALFWSEDKETLTAKLKEIHDEYIKEKLAIEREY